MAVLGFMLIIFVIWSIAKSSGAPNTPGGYNRLLKNGIPARGILLAVASIPSGSVGVGMYKLQQRTVSIDVEIAGEAPYETSVVALIPLNLVRDVLPGATVELRVDRSNRNNIAIVGPGVGFNAASLMTQGQINQGAA